MYILRLCDAIALSASQHMYITCPSLLGHPKSTNDRASEDEFDREELTNLDLIARHLYLTQGLTLSWSPELERRRKPGVV